jgi:hypothetical protein
MVVLLCFGVLFSLLKVVEVYAAKTGMVICSNCHTMHNSQDGSTMRQGTADITGFGAGECLDCHAENRAVLLTNDCIGCHASNIGGSDNIDPVTNSPQIAHNASTDLAAGNFSYVFGGNDSRGHNVHGFGSTINSGDLGNSPPGYDADFDPSTIKYDPYSTVAKIMCAGSNGCHGDRSKLGQMDAMRGAHHSEDTMLKGGTGFTETTQYTEASDLKYTKVGSSYRMLLGVKGMEDTDWEATKSSTDHNEYKGDISSRTGQSSFDNVDSMSDFCAECHGAFHETASSGIGTASPWYRHPVDINLPTTGEYGSYSTYDLTVPVARETLSDDSSPSSSVTDAVVMCLSCHRAHASIYAKIMRWDYKSTTLSTAISGCAICHSSMN